LVVRIGFAIIIIGLLIGGYFIINDRMDLSRQEKYKKYASVIAETSLAAELYRNQKDSFLVVRDSILRKYDVTLDEILHLKDKLNLDPEDLVAFWKITAGLTDTIATRADSLRIVRARIAADSAKTQDTIIRQAEKHRDSTLIFPSKK
jgi:hypothetical protein